MAIKLPDELDRAVYAALREHVELGPSVVSAEAPRTYRPFRDKPVISVRVLDTVGRRRTDFIELQVSVGLDAMALTKQIAAALTRAEEHRQMKRDREFSARRWQCFVNFIGWSCLSLGVHFDWLGPHVDIHLPFVFCRVGWITYTPKACRSFGWT